MSKATESARWLVRMAKHPLVGAIFRVVMLYRADKASGGAFTEAAGVKLDPTVTGATESAQIRELFRADSDGDGGV